MKKGSALKHTHTHLNTQRARGGKGETSAEAEWDGDDVSVTDGGGACSPRITPITAHFSAADNTQQFRSHFHKLSGSDVCDSKYDHVIITGTQ